ncbi:hypothetical protein ANN_04965 [Periplaneta americana]|uniref:Thioester reductase (TE) domain-containing protein n=1 Tax=Periplaneta americana TaxID=6978 RepID=A0ABQ8TBW7_PERAM|nr:hypothetical protein ANN_04965 [Periplaneta americana]
MAFGEFRRTQLVKSTLLISTLGPLEFNKMRKEIVSVQKQQDIYAFRPILPRKTANMNKGTLMRRGSSRTSEKELRKRLVKCFVWLLAEEVDVVFHCAATVRFDEKLRFAVGINVRGTESVLQLAREMRRLKTTEELNFHVNQSVINVQKHYRTKFGADPPVGQNPLMLHRFKSTILRKRLRLHPYLLQLLQALIPEDKVLRRNFCTKFKVVPNQKRKRKSSSVPSAATATSSTEVELSNRFSVLDSLEPESDAPSNSVSEPKRRKKILLLGSSHGRGIGQRLQASLGEKYAVTSFFKPKASLSNVIGDLSALAKDLDKEDHHSARMVILLEQQCSFGKTFSGGEKEYIFQNVLVSFRIKPAIDAFYNARSIVRHPPPTRYAKAPRSFTSVHIALIMSETILTIDTDRTFVITRDGCFVGKITFLQSKSTRQLVLPPIFPFAQTSGS